MQKTHNNCFGSKIHSVTFDQVKTGKHEYQNITATTNNILALMLTSCHLLKGHGMYFQLETIVVTLLHLMVLFNHT